MTLFSMLTCWLDRDHEPTGRKLAAFQVRRVPYERVTKQ